MSDTMIPFGKYKGLTIGELPNSYLIWLQKQDWFLDDFEEISNEVEEELDWRKVNRIWID